MVRIEWQGKPATLNFLKDITDRKEHEARIFGDFNEKEALLKEIHHRVKNNLQVISSLLNLQKKRLTDSRILSVFRECQDRILSMPMVHEALYQSESLSESDFAKYLESFVRRLFSSYCADPERAELLIDAEPVTPAIDQAVPCGLIAHELISNALKHAFPSGMKRKGEVSVSLRRSGARACLAVKPDTLGMRLVTILTDQLKRN